MQGTDIGPPRAATRRGDRMLGAAMLVASAWFWWIAGSLDGGFGDPVGPAAFPRLVAVPTGLCALFLLLRPDPDARWLHGRQTGAQLLALVVLALYPAAIEPLGFPLASTLGAGALAMILGARSGPAAIVGVASGLGLYAVFDPLLGLPLPGLPAFMGG